ncbi:MAG: hypothetical protein KAW12_05170 [Candidatus Aminicenantes bacterium]|nr:hypothetical protein [Candidatus Aminicenantes bacterium]
MSESYGNKIYRRQKKTPPYLVIGAAVVIALAVLVWFFLLDRGGGGQEAGAVKPQAAVKKIQPPGAAQTGKPVQTTKTEPIPAGENREKTAPGAAVEAGKKNSSGPVHGTNDYRQKTTPLQPAAKPAAGSSPGGSSIYRYGTTARRLFTAAGKHFLERNYKKALELYKKVSLDDKLAVVYAGLCCYRLEDYDNALFYFKIALGYNSLDFMAMKYITLTYYKLDDLKNTRKYAELTLDAMKDREIQTLVSQLKEEQKINTKYKVTTSEVFKVFFSKEEHSDIERDILGILKEAYRVIGRQIDFYPTGPISIYLYNEKDFFDVTRAPGWAGGLYDGKIRIPIHGIQGVSRETLKRILFHEYTHALVHAITPECPLWINEGLAEYFSTEDRRTIGQILPLESIEYRFPSDTRGVLVAYIESFSAVTYLIERFRLYRIKELLQAFAKGEKIDEAFDSASLPAYEKFKRTWGKD